MRISDWSSDVCSSDLRAAAEVLPQDPAAAVADQRATWSQQMRLTSDETPEFTAIEPLIAQLAGDYGVIVRDQIQRQPDNFAAGSPCLAQLNRMRQMRNAASANRGDTRSEEHTSEIPSPMRKPKAVFRLKKK